MMGGSVLDTAWMDAVTEHGKAAFLLPAEGLFPWIPPQDAARLFKEFGARFERSYLVLDVVHERYTKGLWKSLFRLHSRIEWGLDVAWVFGIKKPQDLEAYCSGLKVIGEEKGSAGSIITVSINAARG
ncbi:MAG TPA: hypothetical protein VF498_10960 [Anaerolineales bacterium]